MANRFFINGGVNNNWGDTSNWSTTSGGAGGASVPLSTDDVFLDGNSPNCNLNTSNRVCNSLNCSGYTNTLAMSTLQLTVSTGNVRLNSTMLLTGTNSVGISMLTTGTFITGGHVLQVVLTFANSTTFTLGDDLNTNSRIRCGTTTFNNNNINLLNNSQFVVVINNATCAGSTTINITGSNVSIGADTTSLNTGINMNITINSSGTVTFRQDSNANGGAFGFGAKTLTYTAGTLVFNCAYIRLVTAGTVTFNMGSQTIPGLLTAVGSITIATTGSINVAGESQLVGSTVVSGSINTYSLTITSTGSITGAGTITLNGTGTWSHSSTARITCNLTINSSGTVTISGVIYFDTGILTYTAGTVITTNSTLIIATSTTINTNGMSWYNITLSSTLTLTINSLLTISNNLNYNLGTIITCAGTAGWTTANFFILTANNISHTLVAGKTYTVTRYFESIATTSSLKDSLISSIPGTKAIFTLNYGATQNVGYTNATDIDSSLGQTIWTFNGVVTTTFNWNPFTSSSTLQQNSII